MIIKKFPTSEFFIDSNLKNKFSFIKENLIILKKKK
tara:strand:+ start:510 stop:617 length:108 start_codon:yes stop_codon:yes gene_type:complete